VRDQTQLVVDDFALTPERERLQLLLEYSERLPELPERYGSNPELLERVEECQSPVFVAIEGNKESVTLVFSAPREAPTTRGFASLLYQALNGLDADSILETSDDFPAMLGLDKLISPLRVRGIRGMLFRIKRKVRELIADG
jgi:cysteine desulfuration protein SufE